ncbi:uncharacterized protein LY89DRAFT_741386 [Mollisia scopiformis]|uniref:Uncharacterized protein n=1 Tax=Mollisia scopiformis TaxID=149040 RepID=A0A132B9K8_MOLSC|nr:uncharacterized protein LY89DRAFT_741386 [Mollisia scopiformis]KUJ09090.1 hypothetical protein LY89DRAFT_741386 [Mollisia scopiformis]
MKAILAFAKLALVGFDLQRLIIMTDCRYLIEGVTTEFWQRAGTDHGEAPRYPLDNVLEWQELYRRIQSMEVRNIAEPHGACIYHWKFIAPTSPEAQDLVRRIGLKFPVADEPAGVFHPIRRLVTTGKDTVENFVLLFGPTWDGAYDVRKQWEEVRTTILLDPRSRAQMLGRPYEIEDLLWNPRPPTAHEEERLREATTLATDEALRTLEQMLTPELILSQPTNSSIP